jgi:hypothetical protein
MALYHNLLILAFDQGWGKGNKSRLTPRHVPMLNPIALVALLFGLCSGCEYEVFHLILSQSSHVILFLFVNGMKSKGVCPRLYHIEEISSTSLWNFFAGISL